MKLFASDFWIGGAGNRVKAKHFRCRAGSIEEFRDGLNVSCKTVNNQPAPAGLAVDVEILVITRAIEPGAEERQQEFKLI